MLLCLIVSTHRCLALRRSELGAQHAPTASKRINLLFTEYSLTTTPKGAQIYEPLSSFSTQYFRETLYRNSSLTAVQRAGFRKVWNHLTVLIRTALTIRWSYYGVAESVNEWTLHFKKLSVCSQRTATVWYRSWLSNLRTMGGIHSLGTLGQCLPARFRKQGERTQGPKHRG